MLNLRAKRPPGLPGLSSRVQSFNITIRRSLNSFHTNNSMPTARRNIATAETYSNNTLPYSRQSSSSTNSEEQRLRRPLWLVGGGEKTPSWMKVVFALQPSVILLHQQRRTEAEKASLIKPSWMKVVFAIGRNLHYPPSCSPPPIQGVTRRCRLS